MREFDSGATRDTDVEKLDFEGFLSPLVLERFAEYMNEHRVQSDGQLRESDNWQKGMPLSVYMKSMWRHFFDVWKMHRYDEGDAPLEEALCALLFNVQGYLHEKLKNPRRVSDMNLSNRQDRLEERVGELAPNQPPPGTIPTKGPTR